MSKSLIVYFSQGGTTAKVAEAIAEGLRSAGHEADLHNLIAGTPPKIDGYASLGIGLPVYIYRPPFMVTDYVKSLPVLAGLPAFVFLMYGTKQGTAGNVIRRELARKGGREVGYFKARGADYYLGYLQRGYLFSDNHPTAWEVDAARVFGRSIPGRIAGEKFIRQDPDKDAPFVYRLERLLTNQWFVRYMYSWLFFVNAQKCTACGLCMKVCPSGNIREDPKGLPIWGRDCQLCLYCEMKCPTGAILSPPSWPLFAPFIAYNVWNARRDPSIGHARVVHEKGRVRKTEN